MPDIETLRSLLVRVEAATGPDRELDGRIWAATAGVTILEWDGAGALWKDEHGGLRHQRDDRIPAYTASIDAAVALVEQMLPGWGWSIERSGQSFNGAVWDEYDFDEAGCRSAPSALLVAFLRALMEKEEGRAV